MKRIISAVIVILLLDFFLFLVSPYTQPNCVVKGNKRVLELIKTWEPNVAFYTSNKDPLKTIENLQQSEIACWGPELKGKIQAFYDAAGVKKRYGNAVQLITPPNMKFARKDSPRLFLTWTGNAPRLKDAVMVRFSK